MNALDDLFIKYKADKTPAIKHHYSETYYKLMSERRLEVKKVLEIGTAEGASLFAWREFFPNAMIYGAEIDRKRVDLMKGQERIMVIPCDQSKMEDLENVLRHTFFSLDYVIDDGSHISEHQLFSALFLIPLLYEGATYIIEDVDDASADMIYRQLILTFPDLDIDMIKVGDRHDDCLIIIKKYG